jgi:hypothetical protein
LLFIINKRTINIEATHQEFMKEDIDKIYAKLISLETEVSNLRQGYITVNARYAEALGTLKELTSSALEAAKRAAISAEKASRSAKNCATAA